MSKVSVFLGDAPGAVKAVWIKIDQIYLINIDGAAGGRLASLLSEPTDLIEVTALVDRVKLLVEAVPVEPGQYNELRFILGGAVLQTKEGAVYTFGGVTPPDGLVATGDLDCPSCSQSGIKVVLGVRIEEGSDEIVLDFDVSQSFGHKAGRSGKWIMRPIIRALHSHYDDDDKRHEDDDDKHERHDFASIGGSVVLGGSPLATIPECPAGKKRSLEDFVPTATAGELKDGDGSPIVASGEAEDEHEDEWKFKIRRLQADLWTLGHQAETVVSDAGHKLVFAATVAPPDATVAAGEHVGGVEYTITSVTCSAPTP